MNFKNAVRTQMLRTICIVVTMIFALTTSITLLVTRAESITGLSDGVEGANHTAEFTCSGCGKSTCTDNTCEDCAGREACTTSGQCHTHTNICINCSGYIGSCTYTDGHFTSDGYALSKCLGCIDITDRLCGHCGGLTDELRADPVIINALENNLCYAYIPENDYGWHVFNDCECRYCPADGCDTLIYNFGSAAKTDDCCPYEHEDSTYCIMHCEGCQSYADHDHVTNCEICSDCGDCICIECAVSGKLTGEACDDSGTLCSEHSYINVLVNGELCKDCCPFCDTPVADLQADAESELIFTQGTDKEVKINGTIIYAYEGSADDISEIGLTCYPYDKQIKGTFSGDMFTITFTTEDALDFISNSSNLYLYAKDKNGNMCYFGHFESFDVEFSTFLKLYMLSGETYLGAGEDFTLTAEVVLSENFSGEIGVIAIGHNGAENLDAKISEKNITVTGNLDDRLTIDFLENDDNALCVELIVYNKADLTAEEAKAYKGLSEVNYDCEWHYFELRDEDSWIQNIDVSDENITIKKGETATIEFGVTTHPDFDGSIDVNEDNIHVISLGDKPDSGLSISPIEDFEGFIYFNDSGAFEVKGNEVGRYSITVPVIATIPEKPDATDEYELTQAATFTVYVNVVDDDTPDDPDDPDDPEEDEVDVTLAITGIKKDQKFKKGDTVKFTASAEAKGADVTAKPVSWTIINRKGESVSSGEWKEAPYNAELKDLPAGSYTLTVKYSVNNNGEVTEPTKSVSFVVENDSNGNPDDDDNKASDTGDNTNLTFSIIMLIISTTTLIVLAYIRGHKKTKVDSRRAYFFYK